MANYKITVLEVGYVENVPGEFYFGDYNTGCETYINPFSMTLVQGDGKNFMIDSGFDTANPDKLAFAKAAGAVNVHSPREILATVGLCPEKIDGVILTHLHFDHASGIECYPNAVFYVQKKELEGWKAVRANPKYTAIQAFSIDMSDLDRLDTLEREGRLVILDGDAYDLFPGISVRLLGFGHSFGQQAVMIDTEKGMFLHVGDGSNRPENLTGNKEFPFYIPNIRFCVGAPYNIVLDYDRILEWVKGKLSQILMTHDDSRKERFPHFRSALGLEVFQVS